MASKDTPPPSTFPLFGSLPYELRREIYFLATPPRIVHVREDYDIANEKEWDEFRWGQHQYRPSMGTDYTWLYLFERFKREFVENPFNIELHPDLAYFAHNWRDRLAAAQRHVPIWQTTRLRQTLLSEWVGFTSSSRPRQPWPPTPETPEISLAWLAEKPEIAFELLRKTFLTSEAPIPALLHTCSESRRTLTEDGYELAFGTRSHGPRTWFHFGRDTLYLGERPFAYDQHRGYYRPHFVQEVPGVVYGELLSGGWWDVGQFLSRDLRRIQRLILGQCASRSCHLSKPIANILPLVPNLRELLLEQWGPEAFDAWVHMTQMEMAANSGDDKESTAVNGKKRKAPRPYLPKEDVCPNRRDDGRVAEPWRCFRAEEVDAVGPVYWKDPEETYDRPDHWRSPFYRRLEDSSGLSAYGPPGSLSDFVGSRNEYLGQYRYQERLVFNETMSSSSSSGASPYASPIGPSIFELSLRQIKEELPSHSSFWTSFSPEAAAAGEASVGMGVGVGEGAHWNVPEIALVHVGSESAARWYCEGRHAFWRYFVAFQRAFARDKPFRPLTLGVSGREEDAPPPPPVPYFQMKWQVKPKYWGAIFREVEVAGISNDEWSHVFEHYRELSYAKLQAWYLTHLILPEPSRDLS